MSMLGLLKKFLRMCLQMHEAIAAKFQMVSPVVHDQDNYSLISSHGAGYTTPQAAADNTRNADTSDEDNPNESSTVVNNEEVQPNPVTMTKRKTAAKVVMNGPTPSKSKKAQTDVPAQDEPIGVPGPSTAKRTIRKPKQRPAGKP